MEITEMSLQKIVRLNICLSRFYDQGREAVSYVFPVAYTRLEHVPPLSDARPSLFSLSETALGCAFTRGYSPQKQDDY